MVGKASHLLGHFVGRVVLPDLVHRLVSPRSIGDEDVQLVTFGDYLLHIAIDVVGLISHDFSPTSRS